VIIKTQPSTTLDDSSVEDPEKNCRLAAVGSEMVEDLDAAYQLA
jgi:hypothetical protein